MTECEYCGEVVSETQDCKPCYAKDLCDSCFDWHRDHAENAKARANLKPCPFCGGTEHLVFFGECDQVGLQCNTVGCMAIVWADDDKIPETDITEYACGGLVADWVGGLDALYAKWNRRDAPVLSVGKD